MRKINIEAERDYENLKTASNDVRASQAKFYWTVLPYIQEHHERTCKAISGLSGIEIGCSSGDDAVNYANYCTEYIGIDISDKAINKANQRNLPNCKFICTDGHKIPFNDNSFDFVIVNSLLHHLDLDSVFKEITRVMNDRGVLIFREPLGTNIFFQIYRLFTPKARTIDEQPFSFNDIKLMQKYFDIIEIRWFGFSNILSAFFKFKILRDLLISFDNLLSKTPLKYLYWQFAGIAHKK